MPPLYAGNLREALNYLLTKTWCWIGKFIRKWSHQYFMRICFLLMWKTITRCALNAYPIPKHHWKGGKFPLTALLNHCLFLFIALCCNKVSPQRLVSTIPDKSYYNRATLWKKIPIWFRVADLNILMPTVFEMFYHIAWALIWYKFYWPGEFIQMGDKNVKDLAPAFNYRYFYSINQVQAWK